MENNAAKTKAPGFGISRFSLKYLIRSGNWDLYCWTKGTELKSWIQAALMSATPEIQIWRLAKQRVLFLFVHMYHSLLMWMSVQQTRSTSAHQVSNLQVFRKTKLPIFAILSRTGALVQLLPMIWSQQRLCSEQSPSCAKNRVQKSQKRFGFSPSDPVPPFVIFN